MEYLEKMEAIERHAGSKTEAAKLAGVTLNTWSRWANQRVNPTGSNGDTRSLRLIELLFDQFCTSSPPPPSGP
jgi:hypothetical protein